MFERDSNLVRFVSYETAAWRGGGGCRRPRGMSLQLRSSSRREESGESAATWQGGAILVCWSAGGSQEFPGGQEVDPHLLSPVFAALSCVSLLLSLGPHPPGHLPHGHRMEGLPQLMWSLTDKGPWEHLKQ